MRAVIVRCALSVVFVLAIAAPASTANLVTNPSLAGDLTGWTTSTFTSFDGANDATGQPGSGSARHAYPATISGTSLALHQCIAAGPGNYTLGAKVLIPNGQAVGGEGLVTVSFFSGADCSTGFLSGSALSSSTTGSWETLSGLVTAPAGTAHIWISGQHYVAAPGTHIANLDDFVLDDEPVVEPTGIPVLGSLGLLVLICALAAAGLLVHRRA